MKKNLFMIFAGILLFSIPANAQYLLEEIGSQKTNKEDSALYKLQGDSSSFDSGEYSIGKGYRGFADFGIGMCNTQDEFGDNLSIVMLSTTHGYQILENYLYVGVGIGYWNFYNVSESAVPLFADVRSDCYSFGRWSLFGDIKIGYSVAGNMGFLMDPQIGVRYALRDKLGLNLGIGYQAFNYEFLGDSSSIGFFTVRLGIDF